MTTVTRCLVRVLTNHDDKDALLLCLCQLITIVTRSLVHTLLNMTIVTRYLIVVLTSHDDSDALLGLYTERL